MSPAETRDDEDGVHDDDAAGDYDKNTTTETEWEGPDTGDLTLSVLTALLITVIHARISGEGSAYTTTVPQQQIMDVQSNVVPAPSETRPFRGSLDDADEEQSKRSSCLMGIVFE